jgi:hypothetical protein
MCCEAGDAFEIRPGCPERQLKATGRRSLVRRWKNAGQGQKMPPVPQNQKSPKQKASGFKKIFRQCPTLPHSFPCSTIGAEELNFRVRDGNGCDLFAITTGKILTNYSAKIKIINSDVN